MRTPRRTSPWPEYDVSSILTSSRLLTSWHYRGIILPTLVLALPDDSSVLLHAATRGSLCTEAAVRQSVCAQNSPWKMMDAVARWRIGECEGASKQTLCLPGCRSLCVGAITIEDRIDAGGCRWAADVVDSLSLACHFDICYLQQMEVTLHAMLNDGFLPWYMVRTLEKPTHPILRLFLHHSHAMRMHSNGRF